MKDKKEYNKQWRLNNPDKVEEYRKKNLGKPQNKEYKKQWYLENKDLTKKRSKESRLKNVEKLKEYHKKYREENKEELKKNKSEYGKKNYLKNKARVKKWLLENPGKESFYHRKRKALEKNIVNSYSINDEKCTRLIFDSSCFNCGSKQDLCIDHHYPLNKGFKLEPTNAVLLCKKCNSSKCSKLPEQFYTKEKLDRLEWILAMVEMSENNIKLIVLNSQYTLLTNKVKQKYEYFFKIIDEVLNNGNT